MGGTSDARRVVVGDACVLINFLNVGRLDLLCENASFRIVVTEHVATEIVDPEQRSRLEGALQSGDIEQVDLVDPEGLAIFGRLNVFLDRGEAAAVALASVKGWVIATDDKRAIREVEESLGKNRLLTTPLILIEAIRNGVLTVEEADRIKAELETMRFRMSFESLGDLL